MASRIPYFRTRSERAAAERSKREYERRRTAESETRRLYWTARWRAIAKDQLATEPLCAICLTEGRVTRATICDHVEPHRGDVFAFWNNPRQSLCVTCHSSVKQAEEAADRAGRGGG
ncbi:HNH endonuclease [Bosea sp. SSUT16]|uniref:HNH endonuclease n=1 Tax=Bosea spartocytisi TaxID=2773451 RepID=A0A927I106_9HYPH|nr:HNH endonuclease [Bosea spartocytisi]MBD3845953.1 HNH endonuclease [Bosea spartocytisi]MCT4473137.1 HNH endonuclease [Bosea spartocytisi]